MGIQFELDVKSNYICLSCTGKFTTDSFLKVIKDGLQLAEENEVVAMVVDVRGLEGKAPSTMQRFDIGAAVPGMQRKRETLIHIAVVGDEPMIDSRRFGETVAVNRGALGKVFTDFDEAKAWLNDRVDEGKGADQLRSEDGS
jgi:hypothetical protein